jgi:hypothetical protein
MGQKPQAYEMWGKTVRYNIIIYPSPPGELRIYSRKEKRAIYSSYLLKVAGGLQPPPGGLVFVWPGAQPAGPTRLNG